MVSNLNSFVHAIGFSFVAPYLLDYDNVLRNPKPSLDEVTEYNLKVKSKYYKHYNSTEIYLFVFFAPHHRHCRMAHFSKSTHLVVRNQSVMVHFHSV